MSKPWTGYCPADRGLGSPRGDDQEVGAFPPWRRRPGRPVPSRARPAQTDVDRWIVADGEVEGEGNAPPGTGDGPAPRGGAERRRPATGGRIEQSLVEAVTAQEEIGVIVLDDDLRVTQASVAPDRFHGLSVSPGQRIDELVPARDRTAVTERLRRALAVRNPMVWQGQRLHQDGRLIADLSVLPLQDVNGRPGLVMVFLDVTAAVRTRRHLDMLVDASASIVGSLDVTSTAQQLADALLGLGDVVTVNLSVEVFTGQEPPPRRRTAYFSGLRRAALATRRAAELPEGFLRPGHDLPVLVANDVMNRHRTEAGAVWLPTREEITAAFRDDSDVLRLMLPGYDVHTVIHVPLMARDLFLGGVEVWRTGRSAAFGEDELRLLTGIVSRAALAIDNARRYTRERTTTEALQRSMLPAPSVDAPAVQAAGLYLPTTAGGRGAGGDWYDVIGLPSMRVALVVGDVVGHGLHAAATMGRMRAAVQVLAQLELPPDEVLGHLDDFVTKLVGGESGESVPADALSGSCLYAVYDPVGRTCAMASAGHPPPALVRPDGSVGFVDLSPGPTLGVGGLPFEVTTLDLPPDSLLVLYTDGLVVGHDHSDIGTGMDTLLRRLREQVPIAPTEEALHEAAGHLVRGVSRQNLGDDITVLLARTRAVAGGDTAVWTVVGDAAAVARIRRASTEQLAAWGVPEQLAFATELVVSELVTNAIRYAGGPIALRLIRSGPSLICEVSDSSNTQPRFRRARTTDEGGRGLFLVAQLSNRWGSRFEGPAGKTIWAELSPTNLDAPDTLSPMSYDL